MAEKLTFTAVEIDKFGRNKKGAHASMVASLSSDVIAQMGWAEIPEFLTGGDLEGEISAISLELVPQDKKLGRHSTELKLARLSKFETVRRELEGKRGKGHRTELHFKLETNDPEACKKLEQYTSTIDKSKLHVSYEKQPKQADLPGTQESACSSCDDQVPLQPDNPKKHINGSKCTAVPVQEPLAGVQ